MSIHNSRYNGSPGVTPQKIYRDRGALMHAEISVPALVQEALNENGSEIPAPHNGYALIDSGASCTCVDKKILEGLGLNPVGSSKVQTPSGEAQQLAYPVRLDFLGSPLGPIELPLVLGADLAAQNISVLIGRDILEHCVLILNGPDGSFSLSF